MARNGFAGGAYRPLADADVLKVHDTVLRTMEEVGFEVNSEAALGLFGGAGARVDEAQRRVFISREMALDLIRTAPSEVWLCGQDRQRDIHLGGKGVHAGTGGTALHIYEPSTSERRLATLEDLRKLAKLVDNLDNIHLFMLPVYPNGLHVDQVDVNRFFAGLSNTSKHVMGGVYSIEGVEQVARMAEIVAGSRAALQERPLVSMIACSMSPLKLDGHYGDLLIAIAQRGIPLVCPAEPLCGATSPVTLAGSLVIQTADSLMGVMLAQIVNPGTPVVFGSVASSTDLKSLKYLAGSIEMGLLNAAGAQMARFYGLPFYATGGMTDSKALDSQSGYESSMSNLLCALAGADFIHDAAGLMEFAMTVSYEKLVIDNEILGMVMRAVEGVRVDDNTLAFDVIKEMGPGGSFVTAKHTRRNMRSEHYQPLLSDRDSREEWESRGRLTTWERAAERVREVLANHSHTLPEEKRQRILRSIDGIVS